MFRSHAEKVQTPLILKSKRHYNSFSNEELITGIYCMCPII
jgi:hypothetical protein